MGKHQVLVGASCSARSRMEESRATTTRTGAVAGLMGKNLRCVGAPGSAWEATGGAHQDRSAMPASHSGPSGTDRGNQHQRYGPGGLGLVSIVAAVIAQVHHLPEVGVFGMGGPDDRRPARQMLSADL